MATHGAYELVRQEGAWHCWYLFTILCAAVQAVWDTLASLGSACKHSVLEHSLLAALKSRLCPRTDTHTAGTAHQRANASSHTT